MSVSIRGLNAERKSFPSQTGTETSLEIGTRASQHDAVVFSGGRNIYISVIVLVHVFQVSGNGFSTGGSGLVCVVFVERFVIIYFFLATEHTISLETVNQS